MGILDKVKRKIKEIKANRKLKLPKGDFTAALGVCRRGREHYDKWIADGQKLPLPEKLAEYLKENFELLENTYSVKFDSEHSSEIFDRTKLVLGHAVGSSELIYCYKALAHSTDAKVNTGYMTIKEFLQKTRERSTGHLSEKFNIDFTSFHPTEEDLTDALMKHMKDRARKNKFFIKYKESSEDNIHSIYRKWVIDGENEEFPTPVVKHVIKAMNACVKLEHSRIKRKPCFDTLVSELVVCEELIKYSPVVFDIDPDNGFDKLRNLSGDIKRILKKFYFYIPWE